jgi:hypothetical protein
MVRVAGDTQAGGPDAATHPETFDAAHHALVADRSLQFRMEGLEPPSPAPDWLKRLVEWLGSLGPALEIVFWFGLAVIALAIVWLIAREVLKIRLPKPRAKPPVAEPPWRPAASAALALLADADALAARGLFAEAVHLLLTRSIQEIDGHIPNTVRPALTTRDIAGLHRLPEAARPTFGRIARVVEGSLFGGRAVDRSEFDACRAAYEAFAFPETWRR